MATTSRPRGGDPTLLAAPASISPDEDAFRTRVQAAVEAETAESAVDYDLEAGRLAANPRFRTMTADKLRAIERDDPESFYTLMGLRVRETEDAQFSGGEQVQGREGQESLVYLRPEHVALWTYLFPPLPDEPDVDGQFYQEPKVPIQRSQVADKKLQGFTNRPKGPPRPRGEFACDLPRSDQSRCEYAGRSAAEVVEHKMSKHSRLYAAQVAAQAAQRETLLTQALTALAQRGA